MMEATKKKKIIKGTIIGIGIFLVANIVLYLVSMAIVTPIVFDSIFAKAELPDYSITPGLVTYDRVDQNKYSRREINFSSSEGELDAYLYNENASSNMIILVPGMGSGADDYLNWITYFIDQDFQVFSFDPTGTYNSEGDSQIGFAQRVYDLDSAIDYVYSDVANINFDNLFIIGHSMGAYAALLIPHFQTAIDGIVSIAAFNQSEQFILSSASDHVGSFLTNLTAPFVNVYGSIKYGELSTLKASEVTKTSEIKTMIVHGQKDETVKYERDSVNLYKDEIDNPLVEFVDIEGEYSGHVSLFLSAESNQYRETIDKQLESLPLDDANSKKDIVQAMNHNLYSEINYNLFDKINNFFLS